MFNFSSPVGTDTLSLDYRCFPGISAVLRLTKFQCMSVTEKMMLAFRCCLFFLLSFLLIPNPPLSCWKWQVDRQEQFSLGGPCMWNVCVVQLKEMHDAFPCLTLRSFAQIKLCSSAMPGSRIADYCSCSLIPKLDRIHYYYYYYFSGLVK